MRDFMDVARALADESRIRAIVALRGRELCVCQLIEFLGLAPSTVSKHMSILRQARLVDARKDGRWVYYRLAGPDAPPHVRGAIEWVCGTLSHSEDIKDDAKRLEKLLQAHSEVNNRGKCR